MYKYQKSKKEYYQKNREKILRQQKEYNNKNKDRCTEYHRKYYLENKDKFKEYGKRTYEKLKSNPVRLERKHQYNKKYGSSLRGREIHRTSVNKRRSRVRDSSFTFSDWKNILILYNYSCAYCGITQDELGIKLQQEHVIPLGQGGLHSTDNVVPACSKCNHFKGNRTPEQAGMTITRYNAD